MLTPCKINQMECKMCSYLEWELIVGNFKAMDKCNFRVSTGLYPTYSLQMISKNVITSTATVNDNIGTNSLPVRLNTSLIL